MKVEALLTHRVNITLMCLKALQIALFSLIYKVITYKNHGI